MKTDNKYEIGVCVAQYRDEAFAKQPTFKVKVRVGEVEKNPASLDELTRQIHTVYHYVRVNRQDQEELYPPGYGWGI